MSFVYQYIVVFHLLFDLEENIYVGMDCLWLDSNVTTFYPSHLYFIILPNVLSSCFNKNDYDYDHHSKFLGYIILALDILFMIQL